MNASQRDGTQRRWAEFWERKRMTFRSVLGQHSDRDRPKLRLLMADALAADDDAAMVRSCASISENADALYHWLARHQTRARRLAPEIRQSLLGH